jgi:hypothetical protein
MNYQNSGSLQGPMQAAFAKAQKGQVMSVNITNAEQVFNAVKAVPGKSAKHYAEVTKIHYSTVCNILAQSKTAKLVRSVEVTLAKGHKHRLWHPARPVFDKDDYDAAAPEYRKPVERVKEDRPVTKVQVEETKTPMQGLMESLRSKVDIDNLTLAEAVLLRNELNKLLK